MINLDDEKLEFDFKGKKYNVDFPSVLQYEKLIENLKSGKMSETECYYELMTELGLEKDLLKTMSIPQLRKLTKAFIEGK